MANPVVDGIELDPVPLSNFGWIKDILTVRGQEMPRLIAYMVASVNVTADNATASAGNTALALAWATKASGPVAGGSYSALAWASLTDANAPPGGSARQWAEVIGAQIGGVGYSSREWATGTAVPDGSAKLWSTKMGAAVDGTSWSAKEHATGTAVPTGSAQQWATKTDAPVAGGEYSAKHHAGQAAANAGVATGAAATATTKAAEAAASALTAASIVQARQPAELAGIDPAISFLFTGAAATPSGVIKGTSGKWVFNQSGVLTFAPAGTAPIEFDPATGACRGLLVEPGRTQLLTYASDLTQSTATGVVVAADVVAAPDGSVTADRMTENSATSTHQVAKTATVSAGAVVTFSYFVKQSSGSRWVCLSVSGSSGGGGINFNPSTGALGTPQQSGSYTTNSYAVKSLYGGWFRLHVTVTTATDTSVTASAKFKSSDGGTAAESYAGDGTSSVYLWGAQMEVGAYPTSFMPSTTTTVARADDLNSFQLSRVPTFGKSEGTIYVEVFPQFYATGSVCSINNGNQNDTIRLIRNMDGQVVARTYVGGVLQNTLSPTPTWTTEGVKKIAMAFSASDFAACVGGGTVVTSTAGTVPPMTAMTLGGSGAEAYLGGHIRRIDVFPRRLSNTVLQQLVS